ncbi:MAG: HAD family hydrolase [Bacteroidales bacterium]
MLSGIKNIIFDFGGVIINIDPKRTISAFKDLKFYQAEKLFSDVSTTNFLNKYELGLISDSEFITYIKQHCALETQTHQIIQAWNAMLLDIPRKRINLLKNLRKHFNIYLLSNTNHLHYTHFVVDFEKATGGIKFNDFFKKAYFSFEIKMRKPGIEIFKHVIDDQSLVPSETLFIDDNIENIDSAKLLNLKTHWLKEELTELFPITIQC